MVGPPDPGRARTLDEFVSALRLLRTWAGGPSATELTKRVHRSARAAGRPENEWPARSTLWGCFQLGRRRPNPDLLIAVVRALVDDDVVEHRWRQALRVVLGEADAAAYVEAANRLPADLVEFAGRAEIVERALDRAGPGLVVISALEGMAGIGKTALAVHLGHRLAGQGGVLFVNLRGFDPHSPPADPGAVLESFLRLRGVAGEQIPHTLDGRASAYRRLLAGTDTLVVLDNAADEEQVRPLLPGGATCRVLITSRHRLEGLDGVDHLALTVFTVAESLDILRRTAGGERIDADPAAARQIAELVGHLPLGLSIIGGHLRDHPDWQLADYPSALSGLALEGGVRAALALSDKGLPADVARLLRLLALHPGPDLDGYAAAALSGQPLNTTRGHLDALTAAHLLRPAPHDRYTVHDLVRAYARERVSLDEPDSRQRQALTRLFDHYLHTATRAVDQLYPQDKALRPRVDGPATPSVVFATSAAASHWLADERANLLASAAAAEARGLWEFIGALSARLSKYLLDRGAYDDAEALHLRALRAGRTTGDLGTQAASLRHLGLIYRRLGRTEEAVRHHQHALVINRESGDRVSEGRNLISLSTAHNALDQYAAALDHGFQALAVVREAGDQGGECLALGAISTVYVRLDRYDDAIDVNYQALAVARKMGDRAAEGRVLGNLGAAHGTSGRHEEALEPLRQALAIAHETGKRSNEGYARGNLSWALAALGRYEQALHGFQQARVIAQEIGDRFLEAHVLNGLGEVTRKSGDPRTALSHHENALAAAVPGNERAIAHDGLGHAHHTLGDRASARAHWQRALELYTELGAPEADVVRARLDSV